MKNTKYLTWNVKRRMLEIPRRVHPTYKSIKRKQGRAANEENNLNYAVGKEKDAEKC